MKWDMINQLIELIGREARLFESFLSLLEEQKEALVANDVDRLNLLSERQHEKLTESRILNREREILVQEIRAVSALPEDFTVTQLLELADADQAMRLTQLRDIILSLHTQIENTRNSNASLLNRSRKFISRTMTMLSQMHRPSGGYNRAGSTDASADTLLMDRRA